ncbi:MAG TPA: hypothetical protein VGJ59_13580 [Jatrophihabitantaceae bacterium]|jgi:hypothetical protein
MHRLYPPDASLGGAPKGPTLEPRRAFGAGRVAAGGLFAQALIATLFVAGQIGLDEERRRAEPPDAVAPPRIDVGELRLGLALRRAQRASPGTCLDEGSHVRVSGRAPAITSAGPS